MKKLFISILFLSAILSCKEEPKAPNVDNDGHITEVVEVVKDSVKQEIEAIKPNKKTVKQIKEELTTKGFQVFDYVDEKTKDTIIMQQYFVVLLKSGPIRGQNEEEVAELQKEHLAHLDKMYELGYADLSGPMGDDGALRGLTIYNVPTLKMADSLANADPMVKAGRLDAEIHPWWAGKGFPLR